MSESWTDPGSLEGDALTQWYLRSPADVGRQRQEAAARRYQDFFYGDTGNRDPGFGREVPASSQDIDPRFAKLSPAPPEDIDPRFAWLAAGPNRWRSAKIGRDGQPTGSSSPSTSFDDGARPSVGPLRSNVSYQSPEGIPPLQGGLQRLAASQSASPMSSDVRQVASPNQPTGIAIHLGPAMPPVPTFFSSLFGGPVPLTSPEGNVVGYYDHQAAKAGLGITAQYAEIAPWLQPAGWMDGLIAGGVARVGPSAVAPAVRAVESGLRTPLNFLEREAWQGRSAVEPTARGLSDAAKAALRRQARDRFARASGISASEMGAKVHHGDPLEYAHLKPAADPNRLANLSGLLDEAHQIASNEWTAFRTALKGRIPTQAEIMATKLRIDRMVAPYLQRAGVSRPGPTPK
ncbi:MAG: hypothetical protein JWQ29_1283 [Phenylobacterium sp.]|nr:hypothetical protein [Phenylobacterium sp.]